MLDCHHRPPPCRQETPPSTPGSTTTDTSSSRSITEWLKRRPSLGMSDEEISDYGEHLLVCTVEKYIADQKYLYSLASDLDKAVTYGQLVPPVAESLLNSQLLHHITLNSGKKYVGGCAELLRLLNPKAGATPKNACEKMDTLFSRCWEDTIKPQLGFPSHVAVVCPVTQNPDLQLECREWYARYPNRVSLFDFHSRKKPSLTLVAGTSALPEQTSLCLICHGEKDNIAGLPPCVAASRLVSSLRPYCQSSLPGTILLDTCETAQPSPDEITTAELFTQEWYYLTQKPVTVTAFDCVVVGNLFLGYKFDPNFDNNPNNQKSITPPPGIGHKLQYHRAPYSRLKLVRKTALPYFRPPTSDKPHTPEQ